MTHLLSIILLLLKIRTMKSCAGMSYLCVWLCVLHFFISVIDWCDLFLNWLDFVNGHCLLTHSVCFLAVLSTMYLFCSNNLFDSLLCFHFSVYWHCFWFCYMVFYCLLFWLLVRLYIGTLICKDNHCEWNLSVKCQFYSFCFSHDEWKQRRILDWALATMKLGV